MGWAYKTIHYGLKKDGLLGGTFFDEEELEESLNEYGRLGWELISLLEVRDGVVAVFKQPVGERLINPVLEKEENCNDVSKEVVVEEEKPIIKQKVEIQSTPKPDYIIEKEEIAEDGDVEEQEEPKDRDIGSIKIE